MWRVPEEAVSSRRGEVNAVTGSVQFSSVQFLMLRVPEEAVSSRRGEVYAVTGSVQFSSVPNVESSRGGSQFQIGRSECSYRFSSVPNEESSRRGEVNAVTGSVQFSS
jgi:hypothetical protein